MARKSLRELVEEIPRKVARKKNGFNTLYDNTVNFVKEKEPSILEQKVQKIFDYKPENIDEQNELDVKVGQTYQVSLAKLELNISNIVQKCGGIDVAKCIAIDRTSKHAVLQWPNLHTEIIPFKNILTVV